MPTRHRTELKLVIGGTRREAHYKAGVAQMEAQATCNRQVVGSSPTTGSLAHREREAGPGKRTETVTGEAPRAQDQGGRGRPQDHDRAATDAPPQRRGPASARAEEPDRRQTAAATRTQLANALKARTAFLRV